jgi:hypothetical protein
LKIRLSLASLISSGEPRVHKSHQCRSALFRRVLMLQLSQIKTSFLITQHCPVALFCEPCRKSWRGNRVIFERAQQGMLGHEF